MNHKRGLPLPLSEKEKNTILFDFNRTERVYPQDRTIHELFEKQVESTPDRTAVVYEDKHLSYRELNKKTNCLAGVLREKGVGPDIIVAILVERSLEMIIGILGILKAGGAYLPIEPDYPGERINYILADCAAKVLLTDNEPTSWLSASPQPSTVPSSHPSTLPFTRLHLPSALTDAVSSSTLTLTLISTCQVSPANMAYVIYTSGSTGKPKGVTIEHRSVVNILYTLFEKYPFFENDCYLLKTSFIFDVSVSELFGWFIGAGKLVILGKDSHKDPREILKVVENSSITHINFVPSMFNVLVNQLTPHDIGKISGLKYIFLAGEALLPPVVNKFRGLGNGIILENLYGPTEAAVYASKYSLSQWNGKGNIPIGKPLDNVKLYILGDKGRLQPIGEPGELAIAGAGVARGYLNNPELTAERFCLRQPGGTLFVKTAPPGPPGKNFLLEEPDIDYMQSCNHASMQNHFLPPHYPITPLPHHPIYHTGDLARWLPDGNIEFLGRLDQQVKIRGFRIELGEIENQLLTHHEVKEAVVLSRTDRGGDNYLCAYIVPADKEKDPRDRLLLKSLKKYLSTKLPGYMIPPYFVILDQLPLTPSGKIHRRILPEPGIAQRETYEAPHSETEQKLVGIWEKVLQVKKDIIGTRDNFFELGGHSLTATEVIAHIYREFNTVISLTKFFKIPAIRELSVYIREAARAAYHAIDPLEKKEYYPLSSAQQRLYALSQAAPESINYNIPTLYQLESPPAMERLQQAFQKLIKQHESFRTSFQVIDQQVAQRIHDTVIFRLEFFDSNNQKEIQRFIRPFDLSQAPLLRAGLLKTKEERYIFMIDMHHIISDGTSLEIFARELIATYHGSQLIPLRIQYKDYSVWQQQENHRQQLENQKNYWLNQFPGELPVLNLPYDFSRPAIQGFEGNTLRFEMDKERTEALKSLAQKENGTLHMAITAVYNILMAKLSGQDDIVIGTPAAGRLHPDLKEIIGMFVNTLPLHLYPRETLTFIEFLRQVRAVTLGAIENQDFQFEELVERLIEKRDASRNALFDVMFVLQNTTKNHSRGSNLLTKPYEYKPDTAKCDLNLEGIETDNGMLFYQEYCTKLFKEETIRGIIRYFQRIIDIILENPGIPMADIEMMGQKEKQQVLDMSQGTQQPLDTCRTIHYLFEEKVKEVPHQAAVVFAGKELSYGELNRKANQLAGLLSKKGVRNDTIVGLMVKRSFEMIIGVLAIMKAGGVCLPLDPAYPAERKKHILEDSRVNLLLTGLDMEKVPGSIPGRVEILDPGNENIYRGDSTNPAPFNNYSHLVYVIYTSGSTGKPKGVAIEHINLLNLLMYQFKYTSIACGKILQFTTISFDVSFQEIFSALLSGGRLYLIDEEIRSDIHGLFKVISGNGINTVFFPMSYLKLIFENPGYHRFIPACIEHIVTAGEQVVVGPGFKTYLQKNNVFLHNHYGPSETHVVTTFTLEPGAGIPGLPPIGKPVMNTCIYILDKGMRPVPPPVAGELVIAGIQVGRGYLNNPQLTAEKFNHDEKLLRGVQGGGFLEKNPPGRRRQKKYKTGDLARWLADGNIEFLGRSDYQVKIRGFRVEPGEIESQLLSHRELKEAVVIVRENSSGEKYLCAYIVPVETTTAPLNHSQLREYLSHILPDYMIPAQFVFIGKIPLTPNGKVDRKALPATGLKVKTGSRFTAPGDEFDEKMVRMWSGVLGIEKELIGIDSNFFELGGHSLKAAILIAKMHKEFNVKLTLGQIFKMPTIKSMRSYIEKVAKDIFFSIPAAEKKEFYPLSPLQKSLYVIQQMNPKSIAYNMPTILILEGNIDERKIKTTFDSLIQRHELLKTSFAIAASEPVQKIHDHIRCQLDYHDLTRDKLLGEESIIRGFIRPFDLSQTPQVRVGLVKTGKEEHILMVDMHHIVSDGISLGIFTNEIVKLYRGEELPGLRLQYKDFSQWYNGLIRSGEIKKQEAYWLSEFKEKPPVLKIPLDYPRSQVKTNEGRDVRFDISPEQGEKLREYAQKENATMFMVILTLFNILLHKVTDQEDIVVGTVIAGRRHADLENIIGFFVNTLVIRNYPARDKTFIELIKEVRKKTLDAFDNQEYQFDELVGKIMTGRETGRNPLFDILFSFSSQNTVQSSNPGRSGSPDKEKSSLNVKPYKEGESTQTKFDMIFTGGDTGEKVSFLLQYHTQLFKEETIKKFIEYFKAIVSAVTRNDRIKLEDIKMSHDLEAATANVYENGDTHFDF